MNHQPVPRIADLAKFMRERHNIYLKRKGGWPGPWTTDPILQGGRFCNIFRELDTVTQWINDAIRKPYADHPNLWLMLAIARYVNWPPTLDFIFEHNGMPIYDGWTPSSLTHCLEEAAKRFDKVYTGAYMIRAESDPNKEWYSWSKHRYIAEIVIGRLWEDREDWLAFLRVPDDETDALCRPRGVLTLQKAWEKFQQPRYVGWGPFMAYEVVTDLRHTYHLNHAPDILTWANAGPGAIRGLNRMHGRELNTHPKGETTNAEMYDILCAMNASPAYWPERWPRLEMRDIEHSLCEFDKYERVRLGEGKMRSKYDWTKARDLNSGRHI